MVSAALLSQRIYRCVAGVNATGRAGAMPLLPVARTKAVCLKLRSVSRRNLQVSNVFTTSTNPAFTSRSLQTSMYEQRGGGLMTVEGTVQKSSLLLAITMVTASFTWMQALSGTVANYGMWMGGAQAAGIVALITYFVTTFNPQWSRTTSIIFALCKGVALGAVSAFAHLMYPGVVLNALFITFGTAGTLLAMYQRQMVRVTDKFREGVFLVTGGYFVAMIGLWLFSMVGGMMGVAVPSIFSGGPIGIAVGLLASALAAANLLIDFDFIKQASRQGMPKWMEWYSSFGLMVTLVWMYTEILRLLTMLAGGRD